MYDGERDVKRGAQGFLYCICFSAIAQTGVCYADEWGRGTIPSVGNVLVVFVLALARDAVYLEAQLNTICRKS